MPKRRVKADRPPPWWRREVVLTSTIALIGSRPIPTFLLMAYTLAWVMFPLIVVSQLFGRLISRPPGGRLR